MRILALDHTAQLGGAEIGLAHMAVEMEAVVHVALLEDGPFRSLLDDHGVQTFVLVESGGSDRSLSRSSGLLRKLHGALRLALRTRNALKRLIASGSYDVILLNSLRAAAIALFAGIPWSVPRLVMVRDGLCRPYMSFVNACIALLVLNLQASAIVSNSAWTESKVRTWRPSYVVRPAVKRAFFEEPLYDPQNPNSRVLILGRIAAWKGQDVGISACVGIADHEFEVTVAGAPWFNEDAYYQRLLSMAAEFQWIHFAGHVEDVKSLIDSHDIVLHTSLAPEPFGQVLVQAMARAKVVIAANAGGPQEIIDHGETGLLYEPGDVQGLQRSLRAALDDAGLRRRLGMNAKAASEAYHPKITAKRLGEVANSVVL